MIDNKHISKIIIVLMIVAVCFCFGAILFSNQLTEKLGGKGINLEYETKLFDTSEIITVDIQMDEDDWNSMLSSAMTEEYYVCDVVVNGLKVNNVGIRPKGNTSLSSIAMDPDTDRYSLKLEFDHFVDEQTCYGLDKLILNNNYADATNMKEAIVYDMYQYIGADASLYNYAKVSVNGEYWGVYLALEGIEDSFMMRNYGTQDGELYKPESMGMGGQDNFDKKFDRGEDGKPMNEAQDKENSKNKDKTDFEGGNFNPGDMPNFEGGDFNPGDMPNFGGGGFNPGEMPNIGESDFNPGNMPNMGGGDFGPGDMPNFGGSDFNPGDMKGGFSMGGGGANLNYIDDELDSYSTIWEGSVTDTTKKDRRRVVTAIRNINEGNDLEKYIDIDNILKYMAVHTFAVNMDSLSGSMAHNYYLYEYKGQLNMIPWDYNLSFGGMSMGGGSASDMINDAIDTPFSGTRFFDKILEDEEYNKRYHEYLNLLVEEYVYGGRFEECYQRIRNQIDELVITDPTAFYDEKEYNNAVDMLHNTIRLRAESIKGQLNGTIPSTDEGQRLDKSALIDASAIDVEAMGQFNMGGNFGGRDNMKASDDDGDESNNGTAINNKRPPSVNNRVNDEKNFFEGNNKKSNSYKELAMLLLCFVMLITAYGGIRMIKR